jgi:hypothetical protein
MPSVPPGLPVPLPEGLAGVPAGAVLAGLLEDIEIDRVCGSDTVEVLLAEYRLWCRQTARFFRAVLETGLRRPFSIDTVERVDRLGEFAAEEARAALVWSRSRAEGTIGFAFEIFCRLPVLGEAMLAGELDQPRARAFVDWTEGLSTEQALGVCERLLPGAAGCTVGELIERIKRTCLAVDPGWAEKKYRAAVKTRRVRGFLGPDGTGTLTGQHQPAERVIAACERIDALARACKRAGDQRKIDLIRSDLFLGLTDGTLEGLTEPEIIQHVLSHPYVVPGDPDPDDDSDGLGSGDRGPNGGGPSGGSDVGPSGGGDGGGSDDDSDGLSGGNGGPGDSRGAGSPDELTEPAGPGAGRAESAAKRAAGSEGGGGGLAAGWPVPELRVQLGTLLGCDGEPAEVPGWGFLPGWLARHLVARMHGAQWRYAVCDTAGHVIDGGLITSRPIRPDRGQARRNTRGGGIVEIALRPGDPTRLIATPGPGQTETIEAWRPVLTELAHTATAAAASAGARVDHSDDSARRSPGAALRRWIQQRDRRCVHPCCRVPAAKADQDHRIGFARGGPTTEANLSTPCRHDHRLKDHGHWSIHAPRPGLTIWTSPLGRRYDSRPPPAIPPPVTARTYQPRDTPWPPGSSPTGGWTDGCGCIITPCPHQAADVEQATCTITKHAEPDPAPPEPEILDDGTPPF